MNIILILVLGAIILLSLTTLFTYFCFSYQPQKKEFKPEFIQLPEDEQIRIMHKLCGDAAMERVLAQSLESKARMHTLINTDDRIHEYGRQLIQLTEKHTK